MKESIREIRKLLGQPRYLTTDVDQYRRIITAVNVRSTGVQYELSFGTVSSWHYAFETSEEIDPLMKAGVDKK